MRGSLIVSVAVGVVVAGVAAAVWWVNSQTRPNRRASASRSSSELNQTQPTTTAASTNADGARPTAVRATASGLPQPLVNAPVAYASAGSAGGYPSVVGQPSGTRSLSPGILGSDSSVNSSRRVSSAAEQKVAELEARAAALERKIESLIPQIQRAAKLD